MLMRYFGTDGIRGTYPSEGFDADFMARFAVAVARWILHRCPKKPKVLIGVDTRATSKGIADVLCRYFENVGVETVFLGVVPTPAVAWLLQKNSQEQQTSLQGAFFGICITASHNPPEDNGVKCFNAQGHKLTIEEERSIEQHFPSENLPSLPVEDGATSTVLDGAKLYIEARKKLIFPDHLEGLTIVLDTANGSAYHTHPVLFKHLQAQIISLGHRPNGTNINCQVGVQHPQALCQHIHQHKADCGIAQDGDGDRVLIADAQGIILHGDILLGIFAQHLAQQGQLTQRTIVVTEESNLGLDASLATQDIQVVRVDIGDRHVLHELLKKGLSFGGESSGHLIFSADAHTGDGFISAVLFLQLFKYHPQALASYRKAITLFPEATCHLSIANKIPLKDCSHLQQTLASVNKTLGTQGRVQIRYSGTEPLLRLRVEATSQTLCQQHLQALLHSAQQDLPPPDKHTSP